MATPKYDMETADYTAAGWNAIYKSAMEVLDEVVDTWALVTLGEDVDEGEALYLQTDGFYYKALADNRRMPCLGLAIEDGNSGEVIRMQRDGVMQVTGWSFTSGTGVWLSDITRGALTQTKPSTEQLIGIAIGPDTLDIRIQIGNIASYGTTTSTTTTSSTTTTTTTTTV
ncbi:MAG: hypothetical protein DRQ42_00155 [Gammaproteobacteria bacterium]|nr:MAG: hypothetical protein DRQ42_00155 [Gammaproteobacteria bacterium]